MMATVGAGAAILGFVVAGKMGGAGQVLLDGCSWMGATGKMSVELLMDEGSSVILFGVAWPFNTQHVSRPLGLVGRAESGPAYGALRIRGSTGSFRQMWPVRSGIVGRARTAPVRVGRVAGRVPGFGLGCQGFQRAQVGALSELIMKSLVCGDLRSKP